MRRKSVLALLWLFLFLPLYPSSGELDKSGTVSLQELIISSLAQTDAVAELLIEKGVFTQDEFMEKIKAERATYQAMLEKVK